ncbi:MAG TPA: bifunctional aspartate kinase/homoserine dehydrogenase I [Bacteroidales bacterium]|nr:bifunctional aspartate kinase/homoserine dehydrogenase I [Bacteroidales bacterium]
MKVLKFGGTSVGSVEAIRKLTKIVSEGVSNGDQPLVVCSAMAGVTNELIDLATLARDQHNYTAGFQQLVSKHMDASESLLNNGQSLRAEMMAYFARLENLLSGIGAVGELSARTLDLVMSFGEQLSCKLVAECLSEAGMKAEYTDSRQLLISDSRYGNAAVLEEVTYRNIRQWYTAIGDAVPVVTGFIASNAQGQTTTLGRGGSDLTAAIFGAALHASEIQIWTDVDGFMTADPRLVRNAFTLPELSYKEAMELSYFGAKVIYPPTMIPAIARKIPILIKNTFNAGHPGTSIVPQPSANGSLIKGISSINRVSLINVEGSGMVGLKGFGGRLFGGLAEAGVNVILITQASSEHSISFAVAPDDTTPALEAIRKTFEWEISTKKVEPPTADEQLSILAVVGENMRRTRGLSGKLFQALGRSGVNVVAIAQGSSELNISVVISADDLAKALNAVHDQLFLSPYKSLNLFIAGTGNIGRELLNQIAASKKYLQDELHINLRLMGIANSRRMLLAGDQSLVPDQWQELLQHDGKPADIESFVGHIISRNLPNTIFVDNTSSEKVVEQYEALLRNNVSVVACNKLGASGTQEQYDRLKRTSRSSGVDFFYETNVGAGLPVIKTMTDLLASGDRFLRIEAILSGTISFIFNNYRAGRTFASVVREAREKGFTEPDPRDDLSGMDFRRKVLILARETGLKLDAGDIELQPILPDACLAAPDVESFYQELEKAEPYFAAMLQQAELKQQKLRYVGCIADGKASISLQMVDSRHPFYNLIGSDNIIAFTTTRYHSNPLVVKGPGAGAGVTAAGVFADVLRVGYQ